LFLGPKLHLALGGHIPLVR